MKLDRNVSDYNIIINVKLASFTKVIITSMNVIACHNHNLLSNSLTKREALVFIEMKTTGYDHKHQDVIFSSNKSYVRLTLVQPIRRRNICQVGTN